jgi:hypothetical protein
MKQTWLESINTYGIVAELLQKPFDITVLVDTVEDTSIYSQLQGLKVNIGDIRSWNLSHEQLADLLDAVIKLRDPKIIFAELSSSLGVMNKGATSRTSVHSAIKSDKSDSIQGDDQKSKERVKENKSNSSNAVSALIEEALRFLGPEWVSILYYQLSKVGIRKEDIVRNHSAFLQALDTLFGSASILVKARIFEAIKANKEAIDNLEAIDNFAKILGKEIKSAPMSRGK